MAFAVKAAIADPRTGIFELPSQKTMYGGKLIARGDELFVFASENEGGAGLIALAFVNAAQPVEPSPNLARQTPRVSVTASRIATATRPHGRRELRAFSDWSDGRPETELNFKFYRHATKKVVGLSDRAAAFLREFFDALL
ncbi:hypothetical protein WDZ92_40130 [Nostoc sp. NIES-2111]